MEQAARGHVSLESVGKLLAELGQYSATVAKAHVHEGNAGKAAIELVGSLSSFMHAQKWAGDVPAAGFQRQPGEQEMVSVALLERLKGLWPR